MILPQKPANLPPLSSSVWDKIVHADSTGDYSALPGISQTPVGGSIYQGRVLIVLAAAADADLDPVAFCNREVLNPASEFVTAGFYMLLVYALVAQGMGVGLPIFDTTRPFNVQVAISELAAMPPHSNVLLRVPSTLLIDLMQGVIGGTLTLPDNISVPLSRALQGAMRG